MIKVTDFLSKNTLEDLEKWFKNKMDDYISDKFQNNETITNPEQKECYKKIWDCIENKNLFTTQDFETIKSEFKDIDFKLKITEDGTQETLSKSHENSIISILKNSQTEKEKKEGIKKLLNIKRLPNGVPNVIQNLYNRDFDDQDIEFKYLLSKFNKGTSLSDLIIEDLNYTKLRENLGKEIVNQLGIKVCPYCNSQFIFTIDYYDGEASDKVLCQFDHFYAKADYPYLAVSLYNLIPCCNTCNHSKGKKTEPPLNFYLSSFHKQVKFSTPIDKNYDIFLSSNFMKVKEIEIVPRANELDDQTEYESQKTIIQNYDKLFALKSMYQHHTDFAGELYMKAHIYTEKYRIELKNLLAGIFDDDKLEINRFMLGNYTDEKDFLKRPLSKLTHDIAKELGLLD